MNQLLIKIFVGQGDGTNPFVSIIDSMNGITEVVNPTVVNSILIVLALSIFIIWSSSKIKKADPAKPSSGVVLILEL
ncbi:MAG TPA: hypothetical protein DCY20_10395, partial [Firmicutes bacterium]|nr:hypothetical protein [Bacillota bacterium]